MPSTYLDNFVILLRTLSLVEGLFKPDPDPTSGPLAGGNHTLHSVGYSNFYGAGFSNAPIEEASLNPSDPQAEPSYNFTTTPFHHSMVGIVTTDASCSVAPYTAPPLDNQSFWPFDSATATIYRYRQQQSVNMGSWFVQENWMVPSLFRCASGPRTAEIDVASGWGSPDGARAMLEQHWDTFITQSDFDYLASIGINTIRLPIGYWTLGDAFLTGTPFEPYAHVYANAWPRFIRAINMAAQSGIGVLVDLHGAVGSQNGQSHSGVSDDQPRLFTSAAYTDKTMEILMYLAQQLQVVTNVVGIEILNEPQDVPALLDFYTDGITAMRQRSPEGANLPLYIHDAFNLQKYSAYISGRSDFVVEDHHSYFVFTPADDSEAASQHTSDLRGPILEDLWAAGSKERKNLIIGEWSCALTAESLSMQPDPDAARKQFCTTQMGVYANASAGWSFWSYKKEDCDLDEGWCFKASVGKSLPGTFFSYEKPPPSDPTALQRAYATVAGMSVPSQSDILKKLQSSPMQVSNKLVPWNMTAAQQESLVKGYLDGYQTARIFAQHGWSRLGFAEQYINDSLSAMGGIIPRGTEDDYRSGFKVGLAEGEAIISTVLS